ncbi:Hypothetical protein NTJ_01103 [Nesidiocoris tenuis]|uniref:Uncharacterized protein n=1 Tax=Nesidiocoris tenuis TaxID=355587 RepID=A0ABN7ADI5_9HEMI|nr:Hypothetical protein NTJ_01103 [Nesidiocoris tenuis]
MWLAVRRRGAADYDHPISFSRWKIKTALRTTKWYKSEGVQGGVGSAAFLVARRNALENRISYGREATFEDFLDAIISIVGLVSLRLISLNLHLSVALLKSLAKGKEAIITLDAIEKGKQRAKYVSTV